jgi:hypothetical protein
VPPLQLLTDRPPSPSDPVTTRPWTSNGSVLPTAAGSGWFLRCMVEKHAVPLPPTTISNKTSCLCAVLPAWRPPVRENSCTKDSKRQEAWITRSKTSRSPMPLPQQRQEPGQQQPLHSLPLPHSRGGGGNDEPPTEVATTPAGATAAGEVLAATTAVSVKDDRPLATETCQYI